MTKREHDAATKQNLGALFGQRTAYRASRGRVSGRDYVAERAAQMARRNDATGVLLDGYLPTLGQGSRYRALATYRVQTGAALLG